VQSEEPVLKFTVSALNAERFSRSGSGESGSARISGKKFLQGLDKRSRLW
jgi:hypothetical protein